MWLWVTVWVLLSTGVWVCAGVCDWVCLDLQVNAHLGAGVGMSVLGLSVCGHVVAVVRVSVWECIRMFRDVSFVLGLCGWGRDEWVCICMFMCRLLGIHLGVRTHVYICICEGVLGWVCECESRGMCVCCVFTCVLNFVYIYVCLSVRVYERMCVWACVCVHVEVCAIVSVWVSVCMRVCVSVGLNVWVCT
jgi:hypothetical protein